ncbi:MAG: hypothetical protein RL538_317 [Candidatus Parcubacteria bacterium]|jgi:glycosyltransferase involved in cell wall biosynthesis
MKNESPNVIAIGYAKRALVPGSRERERMRQYGEVLGQYHLIVFTRAREGCPAFQNEDALYLYATNARTRIGMLIAAYFIGRKILRAQRDTQFVISGQDPLAAGLVATLLAKSKKAQLHIQLHGDIFNTDFFGHSYLAVVRRVWASCIVRRAKKLRAVSQRIKQSLVKEGIEETKISVLPIEADVQSFLRAGEERVYTSASEPTFLYVGRFSREKDIPFLLKAFAAARTQGLRAKLVLLGDGPQKALLMKLVNQLSLADVVTIVPWTDDVPAAMAAADVLCLASQHEGFAMVLVEAMAAGLPVVTTDVGCAGEIVKQHLHGYIVPVGDVDQYASALTKMGVDASLRERLGRAAYLTIKERQATASYLHDIKDSFTM